MSILHDARLIDVFLGLFDKLVKMICHSLLDRIHPERKTQK
jgi:hypothetical protein